MMQVAARVATAALLTVEIASAARLRAPAVLPLNATAAGLPEAQRFMEVALGPFDTAAAACDYCFGSYTKQGNPPAGPLASLLRRRAAVARRATWRGWPPRSATRSSERS